MNEEIVVPSIANSSIKIYDTQKSTKNEAICDWHFHNEFELLMLKEGEKIYYTNNETVMLKKGDIVFVNQRTPHKTKSLSGSKSILFQFNNEFSVDVPNLYKFALSLFNNTKNPIVLFKDKTFINEQLKECFRKIRNENSKKDKAHGMYIRAYVLEILSCLYRNDIIDEPSSLLHMKTISRLLPVFEYVDSNYQEQINLDDISNILNIDKAHFCRLFKKATHTTFLEYLNFVRVCSAEYLLRETTKSVSEIAFETGFLSSAYFAKVFKKFNHFTPSEYRKTILDNHFEI